MYNSNFYAMESLSQEEINQIMETKPVIMVGSVISSYHPTCIPAGGEILKQMFNYIFPEYTGQKYMKLRKEFENMPFEALYSCAPDGLVKPELIAKTFVNRPSNKMHELLGSHLQQGKLSAIITPNYDEGIDCYISEKSKILYSGSCCKRANNHDLSGILFKIHGSIVEPQTMIYTLEQEKKLDDEKVKTLKKILKDKILLVIGYSGRDFDICPLIARRDIYLYKQIIWLQYRNSNNFCEKLSPYADYVIKQNVKQSIVLQGTIEDFFRRFWNDKDLVFDYKPDAFNPHKYFNIDETSLSQWQMRILNRLACGNLGKIHLEKVKKNIDEKFYLDMLWDIHGHRMELKAALKTMKRLLTKYNIDDWNYYRLLSGLSGMHLANGDIFHAWYYLVEAEKNAKKFHNGVKQVEHDFMHRNLTRQISLYKYHWPGARQKGINILKQLLEVDRYNIQSWDQKQHLSLAKDRLNAFDVFVPKDVPQILQSRLAFQNLGEPNHETLSYRDELRYFFKKNGSLHSNIIDATGDEEKAIIELFDDYLKRSRYLGKNAEVWKLCKLRIDCFNDSPRKKLFYWLLWKKYMAKTESNFVFETRKQLGLYTTYIRILVILYAESLVGRLKFALNRFYSND